MKQLETNRLVLRSVTPADAASVLSYLCKPEVVAHMGLEPFATLDDALEEIAWYDSILKDGTGFRFGITIKGQDVVIGSCGLLNRSEKHHRAEIGFELSPDYWGKGIAGEALEAVVAYGFHELQLMRIEALVEPENEASMHLLERHGFLQEGLLRSYEFTRGKYDDLYMYSRLNQRKDR
ncbi:GNAT family N-acetyltransferase [Exiguobacterium alkaliphilum]|uniref:GNAT family N-acetyltransferase n=1 Tax=Exiguobacterium alkaliphilum TaxID=1428684 RepID=A0ABT2KYU5_9BACL|nr:GNAT family protein [Exiguobacterium alkaliphilum]MCT4794776.1 GNAT family N-acetyltransferase [Exiguobacterium alkaliphilum]